jgi:hypothetical protein
MCNEGCLNFVIIHTSDGIISMLSLFNSNTSSLIQFFIFNGNLLIFVVPLHNLNSLKFVKCSNSVGILLKESHQNKLRVCNWVSNPICVGNDVIPLDESERWLKFREGAKVLILLNKYMSHFFIIYLVHIKAVNFLKNYYFEFLYLLNFFFWEPEKAFFIFQKL